MLTLQQLCRCGVAKSTAQSHPIRHASLEALHVILVLDQGIHIQPQDLGMPSCVRP